MSASASCSCISCHTPSADELEASWLDGYTKGFVTFGKGAAGPKGDYSGLPVYVHNDYGTIEIGDTWYCALQPNYSKNYFAIPIWKVDETAIFSLDPAMRHDLARIMLNEFPESAWRVLSEYSKDGEQCAHPLESRNDCDPTVGSISPDRQDENIKDAEEAPSMMSDKVWKSGPNRLSSGLFTEQSYNVWISRDRTAMRIQASVSGNVRCSDHTIVVNNLDTLLPSLDSSVIRTKVSRNTGVLWIKLEDRGSEN